MTGFSCWPGYMGVVAGGVCLDLVDHHRLLAYVANCIEDPRAYRVRCSACPELAFTAGGVPRVIGCPDTDPAPWYNPTDPAWLQDVAARFFGPEVISWRVQPVGFVGESGPRIGHVPRRGKLRIEATIRLWGDGCDATLYGLEWFQRVWECQVCSGFGMRLLRSCDATFDPANPAITGGNWWRDIFGVRAQIEPVNATDGRADACCFYRDIEVAFEATDPCSYWTVPAVQCLIDGPWRQAGDEDDLPDECRCSPLCPCSEPTPSCVGECFPDEADARADLADVRIGCYCVPFSSCRRVCEIPASATPGLNDGVLVVEIQSTGAPTENLRVWVWRGDTGPGPDADWESWRCRPPCTTIDVGSMLADDRLVIDGRDRTVTTYRQIETCYPEVTSMGQPLAWPTLSCADSFWIAVEYDTYATAPDLVVTASIYPRECWTA